jgi:hypothetical protein
MGLWFSLAVSLLSALLVALGWLAYGLTGAAAGFFAARLVLLVQDAIVRRLVGAHYSAAELRSLMWIAGGSLACLAARALSSLLPNPHIPDLLGAALSGLIMVAIALRAFGRSN